MREIKFRAWNKKLKRFAPDEASIQIGGDDPCVAFDYFDGNFDTEVWHLNECELIQYTGLKDVNGVEIYEGDIIEHYVTAWNTGGYGDWKRELASIRNFSRDKAKVIGNIYENPELLDK